MTRIIKKFEKKKFDFFFKVIFDKVILNTLIFAGQKAALAAAIHANPATVQWFNIGNAGWLFKVLPNSIFPFNLL